MLLFAADVVQDLLLVMCRQHVVFCRQGELQLQQHMGVRKLWKPSGLDQGCRILPLTILAGGPVAILMLHADCLSHSQHAVLCCAVLC